MKSSLSGLSIGIFVRNYYKILNRKYFYFLISVFSELGFGFAFGGLMIIVEIIFSKWIKRSRGGSSLCTVLLLLALSSTLMAVTIWMIDTFYDPIVIPCLLVNELCDWE